MSSEEQKKILFTIRSKDYSFLSNFYNSDIVIDGIMYYHVEGYYQSQKFQGVNDKASKHIRSVQSPIAAKRIGSLYTMSEERKLEWNSRLKVAVMKTAVLIKFLSNNELCHKLLATDDSMLVEHNKSDSYWGDGLDGKGENVLGNILVGVRSIAKGIYGHNNRPEVVPNNSFKNRSDEKLSIKVDTVTNDSSDNQSDESSDESSDND